MKELKEFTGFPARTQYTPIPNVFFSDLLRQIDDITELKITLYIFWLLYSKKGYPRFVTYEELSSNVPLKNTLSSGAKGSDEVLRNALKMATERGTILHLPLLKEDGTPEDAYFINTESDRRAADKIRNGELALSGLKGTGQIYQDAEPLPDIFTLYEQNIGMLTPMIADELREAEKLYPEGWIRDAIKEAVNQNKRKWSYISAILESWSAEGKSNGTYQRDSKKTDPNKYRQQKYGHMVKR